MNFQKVFIVGHATDDAKAGESKDGKQYAQFALGVNRYLGKEREAESTFYECVTFGKRNSEKADTLVKKGDLVFATGRPVAESYINKKGEAVPVLKVMVDELQVIK